MIIKLTKKEGLTREYLAISSMEDIRKKFKKILQVKKQNFKLPGFREGKVPISLIKRKIGADVLKEQLEQLIDNILRAIIKNSNERPALHPEIRMEHGFDKIISSAMNYSDDGSDSEIVGDLDNNKTEDIFEFVIELEKDELNKKPSEIQDENFTLDDQLINLNININFDALPEIPKIDLSQISFECYEIDVLDSDMEKGKAEFLKRFKDFKSAEDGYKSQIGDVLKIDFVGKIDGIEFEGGKGTDMNLELGSKQFIPGFEEQLVGLIAGEEKVISVTFPENYPQHSGKEVQFDVKVNEILKDNNTYEWNEDFAKKFTSEKIKNLADLEDIITNKISMDFEVMARFHIKKELFDLFDRDYTFEVPQKMLEADLGQLLSEVKSKPENNAKSDEELRREYEKISNRRVRLGLLLADLAQSNEILVTEDDLRQTIAAQIMQMPNKQKEIIEYYSQAENLKRLEGPILEEKTVDFILEKANLSKIKISSEEFIKKNLMHT